MLPSTVKFILPSMKADFKGYLFLTQTLDIFVDEQQLVILGISIVAKEVTDFRKAGLIIKHNG